MSRAAYAATERARYARRRAAGLCVVCERPSRDHARCELCREDNAERARLSWARRHPTAAQATGGAR